MLLKLDDYDRKASKEASRRTSLELYIIRDDKVAPSGLSLAIVSLSYKDSYMILTLYFLNHVEPMTKGIKFVLLRYGSFFIKNFKSIILVC